jgi:hypothetical protein
MLKPRESQEIIAWLVGGSMAHLWFTVEDPELGGCCVVCCGQCHALRWMHREGVLDGWYELYVELSGPDSMWDAENKRVDRGFLEKAWTGNRGCGPHGEPTD